MCFSFSVVSLLPLLFLAAGLRCPKNHYQVGSICVECGHAMKWCVACTGMGACTECAAGTYLDSGFCKPCDSICERCTGPGSCTACLNSYCRASDGTCVHPGVTHEGCSQCVPNTDKCKKCADEYFYTGSGTQPCKKCATGCKTCKNEKECTVAAIGYYLDSSTKSPVACTVKNCAACTNNGSTCTECSFTYGLSSNTSDPCQPCADLNCFLCGKNNTKCDSCLVSYAYGTDGVCRGCTKNCWLCANSTVNLPGGCFEDGCIAGYAYSHYAKRCYSCPMLCDTCYFNKERGVPVCERCLREATPITDASIYGVWCDSLPNITCLPGGYLDNGQCAHCYAQIYGCYECTARYTCTECILGNYLSDNLCVACSDNCRTCKDSATNCTGCEENFIVKDGKCVPTWEVIPNCEEPADDTGGSTNCKFCRQGYYLDENSSCKACVANCEKCDGPTLNDCSRGFNGYRFDQITNTLQKCNVTNCDLCPDSVSTCDTCSLGYYLDVFSSTCKKGSVLNCKVYASGGTTCQTCLPGYGISSDQTRCSQCSIGCKGDCTETTCESGVCIDGYYYDAEICKPCPSGCAACTKNGSGVVFCIRCTSGTVVAITSVPGLFCGKLNSNLSSPGVVSAIVILVLIVIGFIIATPFLIKWAKRRGSKSGWILKSSKSGKSSHGSEVHDEFLMEQQGLV